jgi:signal transduction histidine kinase
MPIVKDHDEQITRLSQLLEATKTLSSTLDLTALTEIILQIIRTEIPVDRVTVFSVDRQSNILRSIVALGVNDFVIRLPRGVGIAGTVAQTGEMLDIPDAQNDGRFDASVDRLLGYHTKDIFCMPIRSRDGDVVGVLELLNRRRPIVDSDTAFVNQISVHIGLALELAWSHREVLEKQKLEQELAATRERLVQLERLRLTGELLSGVMDKLNNPLAIVSGNLALLKMQLGSDASERVTHYIEKIDAAVQRSASTMQELRQFTRPRQRDRSLLNLALVLRQTLALRQVDWEIAGIHVKDQLILVPAVNANEEEMQHVFLNLLKNAEEAIMGSPNKREITVKSSYDAGAEHVRIEIADSGPGIPEDAQSHIFEPFFTTKPKGTGTGLGLMIAKKIIDEHGGRISFEMSREGGANFYIEMFSGARNPKNVG